MNKKNKQAVLIAFFVILLFIVWPTVIYFLDVYKDVEKIKDLRTKNSYITITKSESTIWDKVGEDIYFFVDKETGVNYIVYEHYDRGGICPRYNQDGTLYISK